MNKAEELIALTESIAKKMREIEWSKMKSQNTEFLYQQLSALRSTRSELIDEINNAIESKREVDIAQQRFYAPLSYIIERYGEQIQEIKNLKDDRFVYFESAKIKDSKLKHILNKGWLHSLLESYLTKMITPGITFDEAVRLSNKSEELSTFISKIR